MDNEEIMFSKKSTYFIILCQEKKSQVEIFINRTK